MLAISFFTGVFLYFLVKVLVRGFYSVKADERALVTSFGRAQRVGPGLVQDSSLDEEEQARYRFPLVRVIRPGGPYFKWPWQEVHKVSVATRSLPLTWDPTKTQATVEAVTKDNLTTGVDGQIRFRVAERNLYAYLFGVSQPLEHVMGYFISVLRERVANFVDPRGASLLTGPEGAGTLAAPEAGMAPELSEGVSINDLRKNLPLLNDYMDQDCASSAARYGIVLDACLITQIDPPEEVESALAAINTAYNHVSSEISLAKASADQRIVQSRRAVEIETLRVQAEVEPLRALASELRALEQAGPGALDAYVRNVRLNMLARAKRVILPFGGVAPTLAPALPAGVPAELGPNTLRQGGRP